MVQFVGMDIIRRISEPRSDRVSVRLGQSTKKNGFYDCMDSNSPGRYRSSVLQLMTMPSHVKLHH